MRLKLRVFKEKATFQTKRAGPSGPFRWFEAKRLGLPDPAPGKYGHMPVPVPCPTPVLTRPNNRSEPKRMGGPPENHDTTCEIACGPFFRAGMPRRCGPILAAPGALRENPRGKCSYNPVGPRPFPRNGSQLCHQQHKGLFIYKWFAMSNAKRSSPCDARWGSIP